MRIKQINPRGWYDIPGYDGKYQINYFGNVRRALKHGYKALHPYIKTTNGRRVVKCELQGTGYHEADADHIYR